jgi:hypothetical protein
MADDASQGTVGGMASGAATGAAIGSVFPGPGTAIGAVIGGIVGGVSGFLSVEASDDQASKAQAIAQLNYNNYMADAQDALMISSMNAAQARKDAQQLQAQSVLANEAYQENAEIVNASYAFKSQGLNLERERMEGRQTATYAAVGADVGVGTPVATKQATDSLYGRQEFAFSQEHEQELKKNYLQSKITADEYNAQITRYNSEADIYTMTGAAQARAYQGQAQVALMEGDYQTSQINANATAGMFGGIMGGAQTIAKFPGIFKS